MTLSPITKIVIAIGLIGIPYLMFLAPEHSSVASVSENVEILDRVDLPPTEQAGLGDTIGAVSRAQRMQPMETYHAIVERPLFEVSRRPKAIEAELVPESEPVLVEEPEMDNWVDDEFVRLVGTIRQGDQMKALISSSDYVELFAVGVGDQVSKWTLKELKTDEAILENEGTPLILKLLD